MPRIPDYIVKTFTHGIITRIEKESIPAGAASDALNWITEGDKITLRGGMVLLGSDKGVGRITGLKVGRRIDGTQVIFSSYGQKVQYYDEATGDNVEVGTDLLGSDADGEDVAMDMYYSLAGAMLYISSPNASGGIYKIPVANPGSAVSQNSTSHRGYFRIKQNRMFLWNRKDASGGFDQTGLYLSHIDKDELSDYPSVTGESVGTGDGTTTTFTHTLAQITGVRTAMYCTVTDGNETFVDDRNGNLVGNKGGTGTINYATGEISVTFATAPGASVAITTDYYYEDATSGGIVDFSKSSPRMAGEGAVFRQDDGGAELMNVGSIGDAEFCIHKLKTWKLTLTSDDTNATNLIYREGVGIPNWRAMAEAGEGIYFVDNTDENDPRIRLLTYSPGSDTNIVPVSVSDVIDLSGYDFTKSWLLIWGKYLLVGCRDKNKGNTYNDTVWMLNRKDWKSWDKLDFALSVADVWRGQLVGGSSFTNNIFKLFDGFTDEEANIDNYWIDGNRNLGVEGLKSVNLFVIAGLISPDQELKIYFSLDNDAFVEVGTISGSGSYVDKGTQLTLGSQIIGGTQIGGGIGQATVSPFRAELRVNTDKFEYIRVKFVATAVGAVSITEYQYKDIRYKGRTLPQKYVTYS